MGIFMVIYVFSDESGVFDKNHNEYYVYGGIICLGKAARDDWAHRYSAAENAIRPKYAEGLELKATHISNKDKGKLYRSMNNCFKFGAVVEQNKILERIFDSKKSKQRYLDFVYKISVKKAFEDLIRRGLIDPDRVVELCFSVDEHTTATDGRYELCEALEQEFKIGTFNWKYSTFFPPIFTRLKKVELSYCNSETVLLVRAADIIANNIYYHVISGEQDKLKNTEHIHITWFP